APGTAGAARLGALGGVPRRPAPPARAALSRAHRGPLLAGRRLRLPGRHLPLMRPVDGTRPVYSATPAGDLRLLGGAVAAPLLAVGCFWVMAEMHSAGLGWRVGWSVAAFLVALIVTAVLSRGLDYGWMLAGPFVVGILLASAQAFFARGDDPDLRVLAFLVL